jgi:hypothetical protein
MARPIHKVSDYAEFAPLSGYCLAGKDTDTDNTSPVLPPEPSHADDFPDLDMSGILRLSLRP